MPTHVFICFQHGSHGATKDFDPIKSFFTQAGEVEEYTLWDCDENHFLKSDSGVEVCGRRLAVKLASKLVEWVTAIDSCGSGRSTTCCSSDEGERRNDHRSEENVNRRLIFSCAGHSFGGLILREAIALVFSRSLISPDDDDLCLPTSILQRIELGTFVSIASPHCGVTDLNVVLRVGGALIGHTYSQSYKDLLLIDQEPMVLCKRLLSRRHLAVLRHFSRRILYGSLSKDNLISFETACLCYEKNAMKKSQDACANETYVKGFPHVLPPFTIGRDCASASQAGAPSPFSPNYIAQTLLSEMEFLVVLVRPTSVLWTAHDDIMGKSKLGWLSSPMEDVPRHVALALQGLVT